MASLLGDAPAVEHDEPVRPHDTGPARAAALLGSEEAMKLVDAVQGLIVEDLLEADLALADAGGSATGDGDRAVFG